MKCRSSLLLLILLVLSLAVSRAESGWFDPRFDVPGANGSIESLVEFHDCIYAIGHFTRIAGLNASGIARWDGTNWVAIQRAFQAPIMAAVATDEAIYVATHRTQTNSSVALWRWDGENWTALGAPERFRELPDLSAFSVHGPIAVAGTDIYLEVDSVPNSAFGRALAKWDGRSWSILATTGTNKGIGGITSLAFAQGDIYAAGALLVSAAQSTFINLGRPVRGRWTPVGVGIADGSPSLLASDGTNLFVQGSFGTADSQPKNGFAIWDGAQWIVPSAESRDGMNIAALTSNPGEVLASEVLSTNTPDGTPLYAQYLVQYRGTNRTVLARGDAGGMRIMKRWRDGIYCAGEFRIVGGVFTGNLSRWNGTNWTRVSGRSLNGLSHEARAIAVAGTDVYAAGQFDYAGDLRANHIARWDGRNWHPLGSGIDGTIIQMAAHADELFVIGGFNSAGGVTATNLARWDGTSWSNVGGGLSGYLSAIAAHRDKTLVARIAEGTNFFVSQWDGIRWSNVVATPAFGLVYTVVPSEDSILVGGRFTHINGIEMNNAARWDGRQWHSLAGGLTRQFRFEGNTTSWTDVRALFQDGTNLYAGGSFTNAGGVAARNVARWDGWQWSGLGAGIPGSGYCQTFSGFSCMFPVTSLVVVQGKLFAGGGFAAQYEPIPHYLAKWNGVTWTNLGSGEWNLDLSIPLREIDDHSVRVWALASRGSDLVVAGNFGMIEGMPSYGFAIWHEGRPPALQAILRNGQVVFSWPREFQNATVEFTESLPSSSWRPATELKWEISDTATNDVEVTLTPSSRQLFYRLHW